jgi:competence protein ComEA
MMWLGASPRLERHGTRRVFRLALAALLAGCFLNLAALAEKKPPSSPIDLNAATVKQLEQLPGVGPVTAKAIVDFRQKSGAFKRVDDLLVIRGISERKLKQIRPYVTVKPAAKPAKPATPAKSPPAPVH